MTDRKLRTTHTRTDAGRKIDTWTYHAPKEIGPIEVLVSLHGGHDRMVFKAVSKHPMFKGKTWTDEDLNRLADLVNADIESATSKQLSQTWAPAVKVKTSRYEIGSKDTVGITVDQVAMHSAVGVPRGNMGERKVLLANNSPSQIHERDFRDTFRVDGDLTRQFRVRDDEGSSVILVEATPDNLARLGAVKRTIEAFTTEMMAHMSPRNPADPLPTPEDMIDMMKRAAQSAKE